jgi:hypothetical protein
MKIGMRRRTTRCAAAGTAPLPSAWAAHGLPSGAGDRAVRGTLDEDPDDDIGYSLRVVDAARVRGKNLYLVPSLTSLAPVMPAHLD